MTKLTSKQLATAKQILKEQDLKVVYVVIDGAHMYSDKNNALAGRTAEEIEAVYASDEAKAEVLAEEAAAANATEAAAKLKDEEEAAAKKRDEEAAKKLKEEEEAVKVEETKNETPAAEAVVIPDKVEKPAGKNGSKTKSK